MREMNETQCNRNEALFATARGPKAPGNTSAALLALASVYQRLDTELAALGAVCRGCGACCNFRHGQYILYASELEIEYIRDSLRREAQRSLPDSGVCPFLQRGKCKVHPVRPLGCRTFFCDPTYKVNESALYEKYRSMVAAISEKFGIPWNYQPFHGSSARSILFSEGQP